MTLPRGCQFAPDLRRRPGMKPQSMPEKGPTRAWGRGLLNTAQKAWDKRSSKSDRVEFTWKGEPYVVSRVEDEFRLSVETPDGQAVGSRYDD